MFLIPEKEREFIIFLVLFEKTKENKTKTKYETKHSFDSRLSATRSQERASVAAASNTTVRAPSVVQKESRNCACSCVCARAPSSSLLSNALSAVGESAKATVKTTIRRQKKKEESQPTKHTKHKTQARATKTQTSNRKKEKIQRRPT